MEENKLTPEQAINLLEQASAQFRGTLAEHQALQMSLALIKSELKIDAQKEAAKAEAKKAKKAKEQEDADNSNS